MIEQGQPNDLTQDGPPLWSIGLAVVVVLATPLAIYSLAPPGPLREGDTIFSEGQQRVSLLSQPTISMSATPTDCLLDPNNPLIIIQLPEARADGAILATIQGNALVEWPFCPPHAEVLVGKHRIAQKSDPWETSSRWLARLFGM